MEKKIVAVASMGGHWKQLNILIDNLKLTNVRFYKASRDASDTCAGEGFLPDANKSNILGLLKLLAFATKLVIKEKPDVIISTGAAPGVIVIFIAKLLRPKCTSIWIDSIANGENLSLSGKIAKHLTKHTLSQWEDVASKNNVIYKGKIIF